METETYPIDRARKPALAVRIDTVKPYVKNTLQAFVDFELTDLGLLIKGATVHEKGDSRWLSLPAREWQKNGERGWSPILECPDKYAKARLQDAVLVAYDEYVVAKQAEAGK